MAAPLHYGTTARALHWLVVALLAVQYPIGWLITDLHGSMKPGAPMAFHVSFGMLFLALIAVRLAWRLTHRVAPRGTIRPWPRSSADAVPWLLHALLLATTLALTITLTCWLLTSFRGWSISLFHPVPPADHTATGNIDGWHQAAAWALLATIAVHAAAALIHILVHRDRIMQRMLPARAGP